MKQFKVGDTVRLKKNLKVGNEYGGLTFLNGMKFHETAKVESVSIFQDGSGIANLVDNLYGYSFAMLVKEKP